MTGRPARLVVTSLTGAAALAAVVAGGIHNAHGITPPAQAAAVSTGFSSGFHFAFSDGPPARVTGGFGEDSCSACHWDGTENDEAGTFLVSGFPEQFEPGAEYDLELSLTRPAMVVAGFQVAIRHSRDQTQAGELTVPESEGERVGILTQGDIRFAHHLFPGTALTATDTARWSVRWTAPTEAEADVLLHASAVAGDGDRSPFGDVVYTAEVESRHGRGGQGTSSVGLSGTPGEGRLSSRATSWAPTHGCGASCTRVGSAAADGERLDLLFSCQAPTYLDLIPFVNRSDPIGIEGDVTCVLESPCLSPRPALFSCPPPPRSLSPPKARPEV